MFGFGPCWQYLGASLAVLERRGRQVGATSWGQVAVSGAFWGRLGRVLGRFGGDFGAKLGPRWRPNRQKIDPRSDQNFEVISRSIFGATQESLRRHFLDSAPSWAPCISKKLFSNGKTMILTFFGKRLGRQIFSLNTRQRCATPAPRESRPQNLEALGRVMEGYKKPNPKDI